MLKKSVTYKDFNGQTVTEDFYFHMTKSEAVELEVNLPGGLAAYARKAHFQYNQDTGIYIMESLVEIPNFLKTVLPAWRAR